MTQFFDILKRCTLFQDIDEKDLSGLLHCLGAKLETFDKKYTVLPEGRPVQTIGIVLSGSVQISQVDFFGNRTILENILPSEVFAEAFACAQVQSLPVSVIANEKSDILLIDCSRILHSCSNACHFHQQMIFNMMKDLALKTILFHQKIEITSRRSTREKLMAYLTMQAKKAGSNEFDIPFDRQELADYLEVERSGLSAEISKLKKEGILESDKKHFLIL